MSEIVPWRNSRPFLVCSIVVWAVISLSNVVRIVIEIRRHDHINTAIAACFVVMGPLWIWDAVRKLRGTQ
jgi:hypothetical protein